MDTERFAKREKISMVAGLVDENPNLPDWRDADHWKVTLTHRVNGQRRQLTTYFSMGYGHAGREPHAWDVLDCLANDSASVDNATGFEDWANDLGHDPDNRKAFHTWEVCNHQAKRLKRFLGDRLYELLLYDTERL